jgi:hypothetical protein
MIARLRVLVVAALCLLPSVSEAQERHAVLVFGAPGGETYAETYARWQSALVTSLRDRVGFAPERILVLGPGEADLTRVSTRENVRRLFTTLRASVGADDLVLVLLIGHGSLDGDAAKFNLVGPDLDSGEWASLVDRLPGRVVFVNSTGGSFPFLERLSRPNRVVITATDSSAQRFDTVFPEHLVKALEDPATDVDRNGRISLWELFSQASAAVRQHFEQRGQLATERALLDDNGDGHGQEAGAPGQDGALARTTYLDPDPVRADGDPVLADLLARQRSLEQQAEALKLRKPSMDPEEWARDFERLMIELARVSHAIRSRS